NGIALQPCLDVAACGLVARPPENLPTSPVFDPLLPTDFGFDPNLPMVFPGNFPDEFFYSAATAEFPVGPLATVTIDNAMEVVFTDATGAPVPPGTPFSVAAPF